MISIWLCPDNDDELYIQNIINDLSDIHNCVRFYPHCTLLSGIKENNDLENIEEEIGDLLLNLSYQIVFLKEKNYSNEEALIKKLFFKIHTRHPHVFADLELNDSAAVEKNWQKIKLGKHILKKE